MATKDLRITLLLIQYFAEKETAVIIIDAVTHIR